MMEGASRMMMSSRAGQCVDDGHGSTLATAWEHLSAVAVA